MSHYGTVLRARRHTGLLIAIVALFAVRPLIGDTTAGAIVFSLSLLVVLLAALLTIQIDDMVGEREALLRQRKRRSRVGWALAVPAILERFLVILAPSPRQYLLGTVCWLSFFAFVTFSQLRSLLRQKEVTGETISASMSVYLLLGLTWGILYMLVLQLHPESFNLFASTGPDERHLFPILVYFSLTTLSTVGFGDITPLTLPARYAAVAEGIAGQFYLAILVARLVGMQMSQSAASPLPAADDRGNRLPPGPPRAAETEER